MYCPRSLPLVCLLIAACASESPSGALEQALAASAADSVEVPGARRNLVLTVSRLVPGDTFTLTVTGANPNEQVVVARSPRGLGSGPCLGTASLLCLDMLAPSLHGQAIADASGTATLTETLPESVTIGADVYFQAVVPRGASGAAWIKSTAVEALIEDADLPVAEMVAGDLIVTEIMLNPAAVADADGEWFEVLNTTELDMNLDGLEVTDFQSDTFTVSGNHFLPAAGRFVFGRSDDLATNGGVPVDYPYTGMDLGNGFDEIHLVGATILDTVAWDDGQSFPDPEGASMELGFVYHDHIANDAGVSWSEGTAPYGAGDLGTPGEDAVYPGRWFYTIDQSFDVLERVDVDTLTWETIGPLGTSFAHGDLAWDSSTDTMYMVDGLGGENLWTVDLAAGAASLVGVHGVTDLHSLVYDPRTDTLYAGATSTGAGLYTLDKATGAATYLGDPGQQLDAMTFDPTRDRIVNLTADDGDLYELDPTNLTITLISAQPLVDGCSLGYDVVADMYWAIDIATDLYSYDPANNYSQVLVDDIQWPHNGFVHVPYAD